VNLSAVFDGDSAASSYWAGGAEHSHDNNVAEGIAILASFGEFYVDQVGLFAFRGALRRWTEDHQVIRRRV